MVNSLFDLTGKTALVTGATRGIGRAIAQLLGEAGARLVIASEDPSDCAQTERELRETGVEAIAIPSDLSCRGDIENLVLQTLAQFDGIDILICNAGIAGKAGPMHELAQPDYDALMAVNLSSVVHLTSLTVPEMAMRGGGSVVLMSSIAGLRGNKSIGTYGMTKAAIAQLARNLAVEWGPRNVRTNALSPGLIRTDFAKPILQDEAYLARRLALTPLRRAGLPEEVAAAALFLASPGGAFVNGHNLVVDGGTLISDGN